MLRRLAQARVLQRCGLDVLAVQVRLHKWSHLVYMRTGTHVETPSLIESSCRSSLEGRSSPSLRKVIKPLWNPNDVQSTCYAWASAGVWHEAGLPRLVDWWAAFQQQRSSTSSASVKVYKPTTPGKPLLLFRAHIGGSVTQQHHGSLQALWLRPANVVWHAAANCGCLFGTSLTC